MQLTSSIWKQLAGASAPRPRLTPLGQDRGMSADLRLACWQDSTAVLKVSRQRRRGARELAALRLLDGMPGTPRLLGSVETEDRIWLLLEDLRGLTPGDLVHGPTDDQARAAMRRLGQIHGRWWHQPPTGWAVEGMRWAEPDAARVASFRARFPHAWDGLPRLAQAVTQARQVLADIPMCLTHADAHLDNWMFGADAVLIDWETARLAPGIIDVVRFLIEGVQTAQRRRLSTELLAIWRAELPPLDDAVLMEWIRAAVWYSINAVVNHHGSVDLDGLSPRMRAVHLHCAQQIQDLAVDLAL